MSALPDYSATVIFRERTATYAHYWEDDHLTVWAEHQLKMIYIIATHVGQSPGEQGLDLEQAHRTIQFAKESGVLFRAPDDNGDIVEIPVTLDVLRPWFGLWTNAPYHGSRLLVEDLSSSMGGMTHLLSSNWA